VGQSLPVLILLPTNKNILCYRFVMARNIIVEEGKYLEVKGRDLELVERKGVGHPDSLIDGIMEEISQKLSKRYLEEFGKILHHNVDKGLICGGGTTVEFGGGEFTKPIYILLSGRATDKAEGKSIPVHDIARKASEDYLKIEDAAIYPALHRLHRKGLLKGEWRISDKKRRAKFYEITPAGLKELSRALEEWTAHTRAMGQVLEIQPEDLR